MRAFYRQLQPVAGYQTTSSEGPRTNRNRHRHNNNNPGKLFARCALVDDDSIGCRHRTIHAGFRLTHLYIVPTEPDSLPSPWRKM